MPDIYRLHIYHRLLFFQMSLQLFYQQLLFITKKEIHIGDHKGGGREAKIFKKTMVITIVCYLCGFYWLLISMPQLLPVLQMK